MPDPTRAHRTSAALGRRLLLATLTLLGCGTDRRSAVAADEATSPPVLELRVADGVDRGALLDTTGILVQSGGTHLFAYHRADGHRTPIVDGAGRRGEPPALLWSQPLAGGTVAAYDQRDRTVSVYDSVGRVVRTTSLEAPTGFPVPIAAFPGDDLLVLRDYLPSPYAQQTGAYADTTALMPIAANARPIGPDIRITMAHRFAGVDDPPPSDDQPSHRAVRPVSVVPTGVFDGKARHGIEVPLSPRTRVAAAPDGFYIGVSDSAEVRFLDPTGRERRRIRVRETPVAVSAEAKARLRAGKHDDAGIATADLYRRVAIPDSTPRYRELRADHAGRLWVERFTLDEHAPPQWSVYARDGTRLGGVTIPAGSRLLDATERELLLARPGRLGADVLQVVRYTLR